MPFFVHTTQGWRRQARMSMRAHVVFILRARFHFDCVAEKHGALRVQHQQLTLFPLSSFLSFSYFYSYLLPFPSFLCVCPSFLSSLPCRHLTSVFPFQARLHSCEKCLLASPCPSVRMYQHGSHWRIYTLQMIRNFYKTLSNSKCA